MNSKIVNELSNIIEALNKQDARLERLQELLIDEVDDLCGDREISSTPFLNLITNRFDEFFKNCLELADESEEDMTPISQRLNRKLKLS